MKLRAGQAGKICLEAMHQIGRIAMLLFMLGLTALGLFAFSLSRNPIDLPRITSWVATMASGEGITVRVDRAELAWAGYHQGGAVPLVLRLSGIHVRSAAGAELVVVPQADLVVPPQDIFGGRGPILLRADAARISNNEAPVSLRANIWPGQGFTLARASFFVSIGAGRIKAGGTGIPISSASFTLRLAPGAVEVTDGLMSFTPIGGSAPHATFSFVARRDENWTGTLHATIDSVRAEELGQYWPEGALRLTRLWVVNNITSGSAQKAAYTFSLAAPGDLSRVELTDAVGGFDAVGLTLYWLKDGVPLTGLDGHFAMPDQDHAVITASAGLVDKVRLLQGHMDIDGLNHKDQTGRLSLKLAGTVPEVLAVLDAKPLRLFAHAPSQLEGATGEVDGQVDLIIPFERELTFKDITLGVAADIHNAAMPGVLPPLGLQKGEVQLHTNGHQLGLQAKAMFSGQPVQIALKEDFAGAGRQDLQVSGTLGDPFWHYLGVDSSSTLHGAANGLAPFSLHVTGATTGAQNAQIQADLSKMALSLPVLGWSKAAGQEGHLALTASLRNGDFVSAQNFAVEAPGLTVTGTQQGNGLAFASIAIGRSRAAGRVDWPAGPDGAWVLDFSGSTLDIRRPKMASHAPSPTVAGATAPPPAAPTGPPWKVHFAFDQLYLADSPAPPLDAMSLTASGRGATLLQAQGFARGISFSITPQTPTSRLVELNSDDAGLLLRAFDEYDHMEGGTLILQAVYGEGQPVKGKATLEEARFVDAPDVTKFLQALTLYGVADAASGPGLKIKRAEMPFTLQDDVLTLHEARAWSSSLGFTASGTFDLAEGTCDINATIVPAYAVNSLPGKIPLLGKLFSPEKGGGLLAMRAHIYGPVGKAHVSVNPLSALTPGFLRSIFGLGESHPPEEPH